jgi:hypothetical protein
MTEAMAATDGEAAAVAPEPVELGLDARIAAAFCNNGVKSDEIPPLLVAAKAARVAAAAEAEAARTRALDPVLSSREVSIARAASEDAAFRRDRLAAAVTLDARHYTGNEPARLTHLDDGDQRAVRLKRGKGSA